MNEYSLAKVQFIYIYYRKMFFPETLMTLMTLTLMTG